jgi:hypothetical protein
MIVFAQAADAALVAHYRFENNLTTDSSANGNTLTLTTGTGNPVQKPIPVSGDGSKFQNPVKQIGAANTGMLEKLNVGNLNRTGLTGWVDGSFTVEAMVNNVFFNATAHVIAAYESTTVSHAGWLFEEYQNKLLLEIAPFGPLPQSSFNLTASDDWYVAAVFDDAADTITYYGMNLTANGPLLSSVSTGITYSPVSSGTMQFDVAVWQGIALFQGVMDELRISTGALDSSELLVTPEPASMAIIGIGMLTFTMRRRPRARRS